MEKELQIELSAESEVGSGYYYATLELPAGREQIRDARQKARWTDSATQLHTIGINSCAAAPNLVFARLDTTSIDELNFLAYRLASLDAGERIIYNGLFQHLYKDEDFADLISVKDLINMTYGLDSVMVASNVSNYEQLGRFVIDNELNEELNAIPEDSVFLIDLEKVGRLQQSVDDGIFMGNFYIVAADFEMPKVYDGVNLPDMPEVQGLPEIIEKLAQHADTQEEAAELTTRYVKMSDEQQMKYKAILEAEDINSAATALQRMEHISSYSLDCFDSDPDSFFKQYLLRHLDTRFDPKWLDTLLAGNEGRVLLERLGAKQTCYGILSAPGHSLFELVPHDAPNIVRQNDEPEKELKTQAMTDEKLEVVEVLGQTALFTNGRVTQKELPEGLYKYDLREGESIAFATVEPSVVVNHAGTIITKEPIIFGEEGYIELDDDSSPNFLGEQMSVGEFLDTDFSLEEDEAHEMGGMQL